MPGVLGLPADDAVSRLEAARRVYELIIESESLPEDAIRRSGLVWKQDPSGGTISDMVVRIWVNP